MKNKHLPIIAILIFLLIIGVFIVADYGESYDESYHVVYSEYTGQNYLNLFSADGETVYGPDVLHFYGPFFDFLIYLGTHLVHVYNPNFFVITIRHFFYFLSFLFAVINIYVISNFLFRTKTALITTILFISQPLLWGQAFINPKDIPFMSAFLMCITVGLYASKKIKPLVDSIGVAEKMQTLKLIKDEWEVNSNKRSFLTFLCIFFSSLIFFWISHNWIYDLIEKTINNFYVNKESGLGPLFFQYATNALSIPASSYIEKSMTLLNRFIKIFSLGGFILFSVWFFQIMPDFRAIFWKQKQKPFLMAIVAYIKSPWILLTGICIGIATAIRIIGPYAGLLIFIYFYVIYKNKCFPQIIAIGFIAIFVTYIFWPYLWVSPIEHFYKSLSIMSDFPWLGKILFDGQYYLATDLPKTYIPVLLSLQLTEPVVILFFFGVLLASKIIINLEKDWKEWVLFIAWFFIFFILILIAKPVLYDNFRQILFIIPPIFFFVGLSIEAFMTKVKSLYVKWALVALLVMPGLYATINLHPYQYIYYNSFVGGVEGAFRDFETDYWITSFKEATDFLNEHASENSRILVFGNHLIVDRMAREDLHVDPLQGGFYDIETGYDFAIIPSRGDADLNNFTSAPIIYSIERDGAILAVVKQLKCTENNPCP